MHMGFFEVAVWRTFTSMLAPFPLREIRCYYYALVIPWQYRTIQETIQIFIEYYGSASHIQPNLL